MGCGVPLSSHWENGEGGLASLLEICHCHCSAPIGKSHCVKSLVASGNTGQLLSVNAKCVNSAEKNAYNAIIQQVSITKSVNLICRFVVWNSF
jgi:hypothetical protein